MEDQMNLKVNKSSWSLEYGYEDRFHERRLWIKERGYEAKLNVDMDRLEHAISMGEFPWREYIYVGPASGLQVTLKSRKGQAQQICSDSNAENFKVSNKY
jgi:hypothetical protein